MSNLRHCSKCRRLFVPKEHPSLCSNCIRVVRAQPDAETQLRAGMVTNPCEKCNTRARLPNKRYCLTCQIAMQHDLGSNLPTITGHTPTKTRLEGTVHDALEEKRKRTGTYRFYPALPGVRGGGRR
jgi:hypothetical protein